MRQVAATMGMSADEIGQADGDFDRLAQAAKDTGASTRYTASDATDALNYLALAGYNTNKAIKKGQKMKPCAKLNNGTGKPRGITVHNTGTCE